MVRIIILNEKSLRRETKRFKTQEEADQWFEDKKKKVNLVCEPREKYFTYVNDWNTKLFVQKMY